MKLLKVKDLTLLACLLSLHIVVGLFKFNLGINLNIFFTFVVKMIVASLYPYWVMIPFALILDNLSFLVSSSGPYLPIYALNTMLACVIYSLFLYKKCDLKNIIISKFLVNLICNAFINSLLTTIYFDFKHRGFLFFFTKGLTKNMLILPLEILIFYLVARSLKPLITRFKYKQPIKQG